MQAHSHWTLPLDGEAVEKLLRPRDSAPESQRWWLLPALRALYGAAGAHHTPLAHDFGPERENPLYGFLAVDAMPASPAPDQPALMPEGVESAKRSLVLLGGPAPALIAFDMVRTAAPTPAPLWRCDGAFRHTALRPKPGAGAATEHVCLNVLERPAASLPAPLDASTVDLAGVRLGEWAVFFHEDTRSAQSALSFLIDDAGVRHCLVTGLAPGMWQVWRRGWLLDPLSVVPPEAGALYLEGKAGGYFLRRLG